MPIQSSRSAPKLSVVIVSFDDDGSLLSCLDSLYREAPGVFYEIFVVSNRISGDRFFLKERFPEVQWIENKQNLGFSKALNQGLKAAHGDYVLSLNSDTILLPNSILPLIRFLNKNPRAAAVAGMIVDKHGSVQPTCRRFPTYLSGIFNRTSLLTRIWPKNRFSARYLLSRWNHRNVRLVDWVCGAYVVYRKHALEEVGLMDEGYFMYCEDVDWCLRAKRKGWKIYYNPDSRLIHLQNHPNSPFRLIQHHKSMLRFQTKYSKPGPIGQYLLLPVIFLEFALILPIYSCCALRNNLKHIFAASRTLPTDNA